MIPAALVIPFAGHLPDLPRVALGYVPFLEPLPVDRYWLFLLPPLAVVIALVYKAIKLDDLAELPAQAASLTLHVLGFMALAATALWLITEMV